MESKLPDFILFCVGWASHIVQLQNFLFKHVFFFFFFFFNSNILYIFASWTDFTNLKTTYFLWAKIFSWVFIYKYTYIFPHTLSLLMYSKLICNDVLQKLRREVWINKIWQISISKITHDAMKFGCFIWEFGFQMNFIAFWVILKDVWYTEISEWAIPVEIHTPQ